MAVAGKVAITLSTDNGGAWSASVTYDRLVAVTHNNNLYISRKTVANVEPPNDEYWFLALEGFSGEDIENIISGETVVGNANLLEGLTAKQVGASGARNLIPYPYREVSHTEDGVAWTDNGDGTITANGTATDDSIFYFTIDTTKFELLPKEYSLSGGVELCKLHLAKISKADSTRTYIGSGNRAFTAEEGYYYEISARVLKGDTVNNLTIKPMLELGSVAHDFVPYHFGGAEDAKKLTGYIEPQTLSTSILAKALEVDIGVYNYNLNGSNYTGDDLPNNNYSYGQATIRRRNASAVEVILWGAQGTNASIPVVNYYNATTSAWDGWQAFNDGGNAKTLDGHGAEYFAPLAMISGGHLSTSILEKAKTVGNGIHIFSLNGTAYTGNDLPHPDYCYGTAMVLYRGIYSITVALWDTYSSIGKTLPIATNHFDGTGWKGWKSYATTADLANYLPLTGGRIKNPNSNYPLAIQSSNADQAYTEYQDANGVSLGMLGMHGLNVPVVVSGDGAYVYGILHTGNKPTGSYTGNGSATVRTINIGGVGALIVVYSENGLAFISAFGVATIGKNGDTVFTQDAYTNGDNIVMASTNTVLNASGTTYYIARL